MIFNIININIKKYLLMTKLREMIFLYSINASFALYIIVLLGVGGYAPQYLEALKSFLRIYIGLLLFINYNPYTYKEGKFGEFDRQLVFSSGVFLLLTSSIISSIETYIQYKAKTLVNTSINQIQALI